MNRALTVIISFALLALTDCRRNPSLSAQSGENADACNLLTNAEVEASQASPIKNTKSSATSSGGLRVSQCYYGAAESSRSVSLSLTTTEANAAHGRTARSYWEESFGRYAKEEGHPEPSDQNDKEKKESLRAEREKSGEEEGSPPKKISGVGDEAFWIANRVGGSLYVLSKSKDAFIRISLGGADSQETKLDKSKNLAMKVLERL
jgi:hypothetical protein